MEKPHKTALVWFRRSIRLDDNHALTEAIAAAEQVVPVFILDPDPLSQPSACRARTQFVFEALADVDRSLRKRGSYLVVRRGSPRKELERLVEETGATLLSFGRDYEPAERERDADVKATMRERGVMVQETLDHLLHEPEEIRTRAGGGVYSIFTPYKRAWFEHPVAAPVAAPERIATPPGLGSEPLPVLPGATGTQPPTPCVKGSESEAGRALKMFLDDGIAGYDTARDFPGKEGTSRLSAYLRAGVLSPRRVFAGVQSRRQAMGEKGRAGVDTWLSELAWRDFYYQILWHFPRVAAEAFREELKGIAWENDAALFQAWCEGRTGYPLVDAAQRQLNTEAWMHNRARMVTASFLTKDLLCDWRLGEEYFMQRLVDGDLACNNGGWQWAAGTGTDAQPFFRIFNPVTQGEKFDPQGTYVKRWMPELSRVPARYIHRPWELSRAEQEAVGCVLGRDYPAPVVDHAVQRERALALYRRTEKGASHAN